MLAILSIYHLQTHHTTYRDLGDVKFALTRLPHLVALRDIVDSDGQA